MAAKSTVIGIDLGTADSYVAYVGKGIVDLVQNEVSQRRTPSLVGFKDRERLLGDSALAQIKTNSKNTCRNFKHLLGRKLEDAGDEEVFWSTCPLVKASDGFAGYEVSYKGDLCEMSAPQITAMYLTKLREITEAWVSTKVTDAVISVPAYFADAQRQAVLDAARIAGLPVLRLMNEHTATALSYGIYRSNDFDPVVPVTVAFCSMGHAIFSVSVVQFYKGRLQVLSERSDKVGGRDMDECLMREFSAQFKKKFGCDPITNKKATLKLEDAVAKTKKILSANSEAGISVECLMEDEDFGSQIDRAVFQKMCEPMMDKVRAVLAAAKEASGVPVEEVGSVEMVGGASRVPWVKEMCSEAFGGKTVSTTLNLDECVARGCALQAAILSPLYKVRDFKVHDCSPFSVSVDWEGVAADTEGAQSSSDEEMAVNMKAVDGERKSATVFPPYSLMNSAKVLTFKRKGPFEVKMQYADTKLLAKGTPTELGTYRINLVEQPEPKKVKVKAKLTLHGMFKVENAVMEEVEEYEETVKERRELPADPEEDSPMADAKLEDDDAEAKAEDGENEAKKDEAKKDEAKKDDQDSENAKPPGKEADVKEDGKGDANAPARLPSPSPSPAASGDGKESGDGEAAAEAEAKAKVGEDKADEAEESPEADKEAEASEPPKKKARREKKYEWVDVVRKRTRTKRTDIPVSASGQLGLTEDDLQIRMDKETAMQAEMREMIETNEKKNDLESYVLTMRDKVSESGEYGKFISSDDRKTFCADLQKAEDWLYDTVDATKLACIDKLDELKVQGDPVQWRFKEDGMREEWATALKGTIANYKTAVPDERYNHIAAEKLALIAKACADSEKWLLKIQEKQSKLPKHEKPVLLCAEIEKKNMALAKMANEILKEPKPAPKPASPPPEENEAQDPSTEEPTAADKAPAEAQDPSTEAPAAADEARVPSTEAPADAEDKDQMNVD